jgi:hypothetical protein
LILVLILFYLLSNNILQIVDITNTTNLTILIYIMFIFYLMLLYLFLNDNEKKVIEAYYDYIGESIKSTWKSIHWD